MCKIHSTILCPNPKITVQEVIEVIARGSKARRIRPDPHGELICLIWWQRQWNPQRPRSSRRPQSTTYGVNKKDYRSFMLKEDMSEDNWPMSHKFAAWQSWVEWKKVFGVFWSPGTSYSESGPNLEPRPHLPHQQQAKKPSGDLKNLHSRPEVLTANRGRIQPGQRSGRR